MKNNTMTIAQQLNIKDFPFQIKNKQGSEIYLENSDGYWAKRQYDSEGKIIYREDSRGFWWGHEYDAEGNEIYSENSKDNIITLNGIKYKRIDERD